MVKAQRLGKGLAISCLVVALAGCGGGGGGSSGGGAGGGSGGGGTPPPSNRTPVFTSAATASVAENTAGAYYTAVATDADGDALSYSLSGGADRNRFSITSGGALSFSTAPDFEAPADSNGDNVYLVDVSVSDGKTSAVLSVTVTVTNVAEGSGSPPVFTSPARVSVAENTAGVFYTAIATDADGDALSYSLSGGADRNRFGITGAGALSFAAAPDFEAPSDSNGDNVYLVDVSVSDGKTSVVQSLSVTVTNVAEGGTPQGLIPRFPAAAVWNQNISTAALHPQSALMISTLAGLGGFGYGRMQIDFSMHIVRAPTNAPLRSIVGFPSNAEYYAPDCDAVGTQIPVPANGAIEGSTNLTCDNNNGDCHMLVWQGNKLYETYRSNATGSSGLQSQCLAAWNLDVVYPANNRGEHCTSTDAAGFPVAPLLFNADEIHAAMQVPNSDLGHAIRFILPNARMGTVSGQPAYVRPASHAGAPSGPENSVPYGSRLRLRANFPVSSYSAGAQVLLRTMQRYGIVLADGGNIALTAETDLFTTHTWSEVGINSRTFDQEVPSAAVKIEDFEVLDTGPRIVETYDCVRNGAG
ncbi:cadherin repeat domain-containing protein [Pseudoxanthomonas helianthi]|uniref:Cadherin repeat domain-containing protein n=1 Tax=Pseudoxanthomonas helianthi TaxID=1453541 RepID=A0A940X321_9GAMM|nr:cadherin repeat domain-containing protein [Pseudoxanthomonas helianthi]MBP3984161.1 cadherin repeat domain-containing protein [Pseudoxanthomonas helianthi]